MYLQITTKCNMRCEHCCYSCTMDGMHMPRAVFDAALLLDQDYGDEMISIGGGEPTLHPDFWQYLCECICNYEFVWMATNGSQTKIALVLAKMAKRGVISCALSQDEFHDEIDQKVVEAFMDGHKKMRDYVSNRNDPDRREIRDVSDKITPIGRALENEVGHDSCKNNCVCDDMVIDPMGRIWACGCMKVQFGTVLKPKIPKWYWDMDEKCSKKFRKQKRELKQQQEVQQNG